MLRVAVRGEDGNLWRIDVRRASSSGCCYWNDCAVPVEAPARVPERWEQLKIRIVEGLLARIGRIAAVALCRRPYCGEYSGPSRYRQRVRCCGRR